MPELLALVLPMGLDNFAVCAALGAAGVPAERQLRIALLFAGFEAGMPLLGLLAGIPAGDAVGDVVDYLVGGGLIALGIYSLLEAGEKEQITLARLQGTPLLLFALSISIDELALGFSAGLLGLPVAPALALIAVQAFAFSQLGLRLGARIGERSRVRAERLAGLVLMGLGAVLLLGRAL